MGKKAYDTFVMGHVSLDENMYLGEVDKHFGGAVVASGYAAVAGGHKVGILTKVAKEDKEKIDDLFNTKKEDTYIVESEKTTSIRNEYLSADRERRICTALSVGDPIELKDIPDIDSKIYHLAGLIVGDFSESMIEPLSKKGKVAVDVQGFLRWNIESEMTFKDWENKKEMLPYIDYLKTDAAEAEIMTGETDRYKAAEILYSWGAKEIMITHNTEVLVYDGTTHHTAPLKPRNLSGRTGRGDTCFSAYITERLTKDAEEAIVYAAALVSLKMEKPEPFKGTRQDVEKYIEEFYQ